ncbi:MAG: hypothetical protein K2X82_07760 [Gemmataceae bacterium]|nr:hypothetical protein [Gemmataceae bacterium]
MVRSLRLVVGVVVGLAAGTALAQTPGADLFPTKAKTKWVYKGADHEVTVVVAGAEQFNNKACTKFDTLVAGQVKASELYYVEADGVYRAKVKDEKIDPPVKVLALPAKKDAAWKVDSKVGGQAVKGEFKIIDEKAKIKTPAGEFDCVVVEGADMDIAGTKTTVKQYFAPGKGLVKIGFTIQGTESTLELKEFSEGK